MNKILYVLLGICITSCGVAKKFKRHTDKEVHVSVTDRSQVFSVKTEIVKGDSVVHIPADSLQINMFIADEDSVFEQSFESGGQQLTIKGERKNGKTKLNVKAKTKPKDVPANYERESKVETHTRNNVVAKSAEKTKSVQKDVKRDGRSFTRWMILGAVAVAGFILFLFRNYLRTFIKS